MICEIKDVKKVRKKLFFLILFSLTFNSTMCLAGRTSDNSIQNLALYRSVTTSSVGHYAVIPEFAVDGEADTGWRSARKQDSAEDWLTVDLEAICDIDQVRLTWDSCSARPVFEDMRTTSLFGSEQVASYGISYSILLSIDGQNWETVYKTTLGDGGEDIVHLAGQNARYVSIAVYKRSQPACGIGINEITVLGNCTTDRPKGDSWKLRRKVKVSPVPARAASKDRELLLNSGWELTREDWAELTVTDICNTNLDTSNWYNATVPGTILTTLVEQKVFPEPTIGMNCLSIPDNLCRHVWWYRTKLDIPTAWTKDNQLLWLDFDGINYCAEIWLNSYRLGMINGAFMRGEFEISKFLNDKDNVLAVRILPPAHPGMPLEKRDDFRLYNGGALGKDSPAFVASIGWDWMAPVRDRGMGIWNDVRIRRTGDIIIGDPKVITDLPLPKLDSADISITVPVKNTTDVSREVTVNARFDNISILKTLTVDARSTIDVNLTPAEYIQLSLKNPKLWWPGGYGDQYLYDLKLSVQTASMVSDIHEMHFGIRELSYRGKKLDPQPVPDDNQPDELEISVNGQRIFCRGGNWGYPEMLLRLTDRRMEASIRLHHEANMTMIRNWVGQNTTKKLYDLCDKYGILVWNDFWLANPGDGPNPDNPQLFLQNARDVVLQYRNHPSIAIWCGRNEGLPPKILDDGLQQLTDELDGTRYYQSHSSDIGVNGRGPYKYVPPIKYFEEYTHGFKTEIGMPSVPSADSIRKMLDDPDPWPIDQRWTYHDFVPKGNQYRDDYVKFLNTKFGPAVGLDDFCRKAQMINYDGYRAIFESCNHKLWNDCSGLFLWMSHPAWPSMVWQVYDYWFATDGAYFGAAKSNESVHIQLCTLNDMVEMINHTDKKYSGTVSAKVLNLDSELLWQHTASVSANKNSRTDAYKITWPEAMPNAYLIRLDWLDESGRHLSENTYWLGNQDKDLQALNNMPNVKLQAMLSRDIVQPDKRVQVKIVNTSNKVALMVQAVLRDSKTGERILPAYYSSNFMSFLPGETKSITIDYHNKDIDNDIKVSIIGWNVEPIDIK